MQYGYQERQLDVPSRWMENGLSGIVAVILHLLMLVLLALVPWGEFSSGEGGEGDQILIGQLSRQQLIDNPVDRLQDVAMENPIESRVIQSLSSDLVSPRAFDSLVDAEFDLTLGAPPSGGQSIV